MSGSITERLQLVVDATTSGAEARFDKLTARARETGDASVRSAADVATAADKVLAAQARQADAAGQVLVAEKRLQELREKGTASSSQLEAAQQKLESAQRKLHLATRDVTGATEAQEHATREATDAAQDATQESDRYGDRLGELKGRVAGLVAGGALVSYLKGTAAGFLDGARGAATLATSMNATTLQAGQLSQLLTSVGLDAADVLEIQAEFAQKIAANSNALGEFGAEVKRNEDGTTNWALTLEDALVNLQQIPDATERNRRGFALFGEEGYKQLSRLLNSGMAVDEALAAIGTPFTDDDVAATRAYDQAMMRLQMTSGQLGRTVGRELVPIITGVVDGFGKVAAVVTAIPAPIALTTAAAIALGITGFSPAAAAGGALATTMAAVRTEVALASAAMATGTASAGALGGSLSVAAAAGGRVGGLVGGALGGPLGIGLIAAGGAFYFASQGAADLETHAKDAAVELAASEDAAGDAGQTVEKLGRQLAASAGFFEKYAALAQTASEAVNEAAPGPGGDILGTGALFTAMKGGKATADAFTAVIQKARDELGEYAAQSAAAEAATFTLQELVAQGKTSGEDYATAVQAAADAQTREAATAGQAEAAVAALRAVTDQAYQSQLNLINAELARNDATYSFLDAMDQANAAVDDQATSVDEVAQANDRLKAAALNAADAAADAAVAAATANGTVLTELAEAQVRADAVIADLQARLNTPGLGEGARNEIQGIIDRLTTAKDNGTITAELQTLGVDEAAGKLDEATEDRTALVRVESRNGPAVEEYLGRLAGKDRLAIVRVESRNGPAVDTYVDGLARERLAIIRVETRGGPDVDRYLDNLASQERTAVIDVRRPGSGAPGSPTGAPSIFGAPAAGLYGAAGDVVVEQLTVTVQGDGAGRISQQSLADGGRQLVRQLGAYTRQNGNGWLKGMNT